MTDASLSFALREVRDGFGRPLQWVILLAVAVILAMAGAFGTGDVLRPVPLVLYWVGIVVTTYGIGDLIHTLLNNHLKNSPLALRIAVAGLATGLAISLWILAVNTALFGRFTDGLAETLIFAATTIAVTLVVSAVLQLAFTQVAAQTPQVDLSTAPRPALLDRLPVDKRGALVALSVEDHYVRIRTTLGEEMILMRLSDAMAEAAEAGFQVHRSHWIAPDQVTAARRDGDRAILTMTHGPDIPVSRAYVPTLREAGLLPAKRDG